MASIYKPLYQLKLSNPNAPKDPFSVWMRGQGYSENVDFSAGVSCSTHGRREGALYSYKDHKYHCHHCVRLIWESRSLGDTELPDIRVIIVTPTEVPEGADYPTRRAIRQRAFFNGMNGYAYSLQPVGHEQLIPIWDMQRVDILGCFKPEEVFRDEI